MTGIWSGISASSPGLGQGAEFTVRLPLCAEGPPAMRESTRADAAVGSSRRVLIVDDNADAADSLCTLLQLSGHTARTVYRGGDALREIARFHPDVVLLDIGLPDLNGYEVARRARALNDGRCPKLVALSGWGRAEDKELALEAGIDIHLTKPVDAATLQQVLENAGRDATRAN